MKKNIRYVTFICIGDALSRSYISVTFLIMYGTMWSLNMQFDLKFFTLSHVLLSYMQQSSVKHFNYALRDLLNYMAAQERIRVCFDWVFLECNFKHNILRRHFFYSMSLNEINAYYLTHSSLRLKRILVMRTQYRERSELCAK